MIDHRKRLEAIVRQGGTMTWDMMPSDLAAIRWALEEIDRLRAGRCECGPQGSPDGAQGAPGRRVDGVSR